MVAASSNLDKSAVIGNRTSSPSVVFESELCSSTYSHPVWDNTIHLYKVRSRKGTILFTKLQLTFQDFTRPPRIVALATKNNDGVFNNHSSMIEPSLAEKDYLLVPLEKVNLSQIFWWTNSTSKYNSQSTQIDHFARRYKLSLQAHLDHHMPPRCCQLERACAGFFLR